MKRRIYRRNSNRLTKYIEKNSIDIVITSPPYKEKEGYSEQLMRDVAKRISRVLKPGKLAFINFGDVGEEPGRIYKVQSIFAEYLDFQFDIIWAFSFDGKGRFQPLNTNKRPNRLHEKILVFSSKGRQHAIDRLAVGVPFSDKSNISRRGHEQDLRCRGDIWFIPYENKTGKNYHKYKFPDMLVSNCILLSGEKTGGTILDPFLGGGTVIDVGISMGFNVIGFEKDKKTYNNYLKKFNEKRK